MDKGSLKDYTQKGIKEARRLFERKLVSESKNVLLWADGYIDYRRKAIAKRDSPEDYEPMRRMGELGKKITEASGKSLTVEWTLRERDPGGFCSNTGKALQEMQVPITMISSYGSRRINPIFKDIADNCREIISIGRPGETQAVEFRDGKVMLVDPGGPHELSWKRILNEVGNEKLTEFIEGADLFGQGYWSFIPRMNTIWKKLLEEVFPSFSDDKNRHMFLDLADIRRRSEEEMLEAMDLISQFQNYFDVTLSLNESEASILADLLATGWEEKSREKIADSALKMGSKIGIEDVVIHTINFALVASSGKETVVEHPYDPTPKVTTGAGDHFNAGYIFGILNELGPEGRLALGCSNAGFFVREGQDPSPKEIRDFLGDYESFLQ